MTLADTEAPRAPETPASGIGWAHRGLLACLVLVLVVVTVSVLPGVRPRTGPYPFVVDVLQPLGYVLAAAAAGWATLRRPSQRPAWTLVSVGLVLRAYGFVHTIYVLDRAAVYPSLADVAWVSSGLCLLGGVLLLAREVVPRDSPSLAVDALMGALTAAAVGATLLAGTVGRLIPEDTPRNVVLVNLAYPVLDIALLMAAAGLVAGVHGRLQRSSAVLAAGVLGFVVTDSLYLFQASTGTFRPGSFLTALALGSTVLIALAPLWSLSPRTPRPAWPAGLWLPRVLALICLTVLVLDAFADVPPAGIAQAALGIAVGLVRVSMTQSSFVRRSEAVIAEKDEELVQFRALVEASRDFIALGSLQGRVQYLNPAGRRMVGIPVEGPLPDLTIGQMLTPEAAQHQAEVERPHILATGSWRGESTLLHRDGHDPVPVFKNTFVVRHDDGSPWLLGTIQRDITDLHAARRQLQQLADDRQVLLRHLVEAQEAERTRIAADVHDDPVQVMAAVDLQLGLAQRQLELGADPADVSASLAQMRETVAEANDRLRYLLFDLDSPAQREDVGTALGEAAAYVLGDSVRTEVRCEDGLQLDPTVRVLVYRIAKEAMVNVRKHAAAARVDLRVRRVDGGVEVTVTDDGVGIAREEPTPQPGHRGLSDMRDRAAIAGGTVTIAPGSERGTVVRLWIPLSADADGHQQS